MSHEADLIEQAEHLATRDARRPKQANLRRAVSAAYYAVFHTLVQAASTALGSDPGIRSLVARVPRHEDIKRACKVALTSGGWQGPLRDVAGGPAVPSDLSLVAEAFVELQEARHEADYNLSRSFTRVEVLAQVQAAKDAVDAWGRVGADRSATLFLMLVLFGDRWRR